MNLSKIFNKFTAKPAAWTIGLGVLTAFNLASGSMLGLAFAGLTGYGAYVNAREWKARIG